MINSSSPNFAEEHEGPYFSDNIEFIHRDLMCLGAADRAVRLSSIQLLGQRYWLLGEWRRMGMEWIPVPKNVLVLDDSVYMELVLRSACEAICKERVRVEKEREEARTDNK